MMRLLYAFLCAGLLLHTACDRPLTKIVEPHLERRQTGDEQPDNERQHQQQLRRMRQEIVELAGEARCNGADDCRYVGLGAKPCGGPWEYLIFSTLDTDMRQLRKKVAAYHAFEQRLNAHYGDVSDCAIPAEPRLGCVEGRCVDLNRQRPAEVRPDPAIGQPRFVRSVDDVPAGGHPFALEGAATEGDQLVVRVSYSGGCKPHLFYLFAVQQPAERALPPRHQVFLFHRTTDDLCKAYITEELRFDLKPFRRLHPGQEKIALALEGLEELLEYSF